MFLHAPNLAGAQSSSAALCLPHVGTSNLHLLICLMVGLVAEFKAQLLVSLSATERNESRLSDSGHGKRKGLRERSRLV